MIDSCYLGDVRDGLRAMIADGVRARTCVTSPPYWGLRDYGVTGQLGLEATPEEYVANMVAVFREVRRVLRDDGTLWLNLGDSYAASAKGSGGTKSKQPTNAGSFYAARFDLGTIKPKDLVGIPWRVAFALQEDGWWLRQDIIWSKPNPMPESIRDRCTKAHDYLFLLSNSDRYYFDQEAIKEPVTGTAHRRKSRPVPAGWETGKEPHEPIAHNRPKRAAAGSGTKYNTSYDAAITELVERRNRRSVWTIPTEPFPEAHFATFPTALVEPCVLAGSAIGDVVLDPFMGSGTVAQVAQALGRSWVGCELNPEYHAMIARRTRARGLALA